MSLGGILKTLFRFTCQIPEQQPCLGDKRCDNEVRWVLFLTCIPMRSRPVTQQTEDECQHDVKKPSSDAGRCGTKVDAPIPSNDVSG